MGIFQLRQLTSSLIIAGTAATVALGQGMPIPDAPVLGAEIAINF